MDLLGGYRRELAFYRTVAGYESPMTLIDGTELTVASMEVFRVIDGRITEVRNCGYKQRVWA